MVVDRRGDRRVVLTRFGKEVAVVSGSEILEDGVALVRSTAEALIGELGDRAASLSTYRRFDEVCDVLDIDAEEVCARPEELREP